MKKIIHIFDDDKFIDPTIKLFESVHPDHSTYFILKSDNEPFKFVKSEKATAVVLKNDDDVRQFCEKINGSDAEVVFFHALNTIKQKIAIGLPEKWVKVWFIWGYDFYLNWKLISPKLYGKETDKYLDKKISLKNRLLYSNFSFSLFSLSKRYSKFFPKIISNKLDQSFDTEFYRAAKEMDFVVPVIPLEFELVKKMKIKARFAPFTYGCIEDILGDKINETVIHSRNILIGNSGDSANNHLDIFETIKSVNWNDRLIYVPLSYGGNKEYREHIIQKGKEYFGDNFKPLTEFMSLDEYNKIIASCGFVIFNHIRQQGVGNIISLAHMGAKIFLNEKSPVYVFYKSLGMTIFSMEECNQETLASNLTEEQRQANRQIVSDNYSYEAVKNKITTLVNLTNSIQNKER